MERKLEMTSGIAVSETSTSSDRKSLTVIASLFFIFGFLTCMNDILVPHLKSLFTLTYSQAILVQFCFFSSYFLMSIPSAQFCERLGYKNGMLAGLFITSLGAFGFYSSAKFTSFPLFLTAFFVLAVGITLLQVAVNPFVTLLGAPEKASSRLNLVQSFNSLGTTLAPLIGTALILSHTGSGTSIQGPYLAISVILLVVIGFIASVKLPSFHETTDAASYLSIFRAHPRLAWGCFAIFCYVGAEVSIGSFMVNWLQEPSVGGMSAEAAGRLITYYWGGAMVGRFIGTPILSQYRPHRVLMLYVTLAIAGVVVSISSSGTLAVWSILSVGLFNSIMFPTIFSQSVEGLNSAKTAKASGLLCTAIVGGAIVPLLQGTLADAFGLRSSYWIAIACYGYLLVFAQRLHRLKN